MELVVYLGIIFVGILVIFVNGAIYERKRYRIFLRSLDEDYGVYPKREYADGDMSRISRYYDSLTHDGYHIDDITWNDLDMDLIYKKMNATQTSAGEEYLYFLLRTPLLEDEELKKRDSLIRFTMEQSEKRKELQKVLNKIGRVRKISLTDYLLLLRDVEREGNLKHYLLDLLIFLSFGLIFVSPGWGTLLFMASLAYSITWYYRRKGNISPYITTFNHIIKMLQAAQEIEKLHYSELDEYIAQTREARQIFKNFKRNTYILSVGSRTSANILDLLLDYIRMIFHLDITKFNSMLKLLQDHYDHIYVLRDTIGLIDSAISIGSYRTALDYYATPAFEKWDGKHQVMLSTVDVYHPLISNPVTNSISETRGALLTGSNASGKSTFLKTIAVNALLSQTIYTSLSREYCANMFYIYSSMALRDDLMSSESYFIVEIKSLKRILDAGKEVQPILCFIDEVLRGTNTVERIAASSKIMESLAKDHIMCFAATHDIELTHMLEQQYDNYHFQEEIEENDIHFNYHLFQGRAKTRNAIKLLRVIGYEEDIIDDAEAIAARFVETGNWEM